MINRDYVRGYFDAHGYVAKWTDRGYIRYAIRFDEKDGSQRERVNMFLRGEGYHLTSVPHKNSSIFGASNTYHTVIGRIGDMKRFVEEIGTERPELQERFNEFLKK